jgi:hypothetical protein
MSIDPNKVIRVKVIRTKAVVEDTAPHQSKIPLADRCAPCVVAYIKKNPGTQANQARVNHKGDECRRPADEHADYTHANMAVVATSLPEGITAYHKFYIDSGAKC